MPDFHIQIGSHLGMLLGFHVEGENFQLAAAAAAGAENGTEILS